MDDAGARGPSAAEMAAHRAKQFGSSLGAGGGVGGGPGFSGQAGTVADGVTGGMGDIRRLEQGVGRFITTVPLAAVGGALRLLAFLFMAVWKPARALFRFLRKRRRERATPEGRARIDIKKERRAANRQRRQVRRVRNRARRRVFYARVRRFLSRLRLRAGNLRRMLGARMVRLRVFLRATRRLNAQRRENNRAARELLRGTRDREQRRQIIEARNERNREAVGARADRLNRFDARGGRELYTRRVRAEIERRNRAFDHISHPTNVRLTETLRDRARADAADSDYRAEHRRHMRELRVLYRKVRKNDILPEEVRRTELPRLRVERRQMRQRFEAARQGAPMPPTTAPTTTPPATTAPATNGTSTNTPAARVPTTDPTGSRNLNNPRLRAASASGAARRRPRDGAAPSSRAIRTTRATPSASR
ncbi:hypothetical protein HNR12_002829 [Streptomonospora nanhaiensis]|uniref:Uncharacterized protein n=1 Tax=Streptomonospora nanhaiensis TaxID=1323731 RepID=A0A853BQ56_9ACTN|nr:hypothetical protein [Streptomonospora nanhaiensis]NYI96552.1 hypothetical protein [Streptomonospora nanhaiensis]